MGAEAVRYQFDTVEVLPAAFTVLRDGRAAVLEPKAFRVLLYLIEHRDRAVNKAELIDGVWEGTAVTDNALSRIVAQIRRQLGDDAHEPRYIQTVNTIGYRFVADVRVVTAEENLAPLPPRRSTGLWRITAAALIVIVAVVTGWLLLRRDGIGADLQAVQLTTSTGLDIGASFSPDGRSLVYCSNRSGRFEIYTRLTASSAGERQLTADGMQNLDPAWSPDGKWIAYQSVVQRGIWLIPASGGAPRRLTEFGSAPAWAPDGQRIAFRSTEPVSFAWSDLGGAGPSTVWTVAADGSQLRRVTELNNPPGQPAMPAWSPDGKSLVFVAMAPQSAIWSLDLASGKLDTLVQVGRDVPRQPGTWFTRLADPTYSPAGQGLYFSALSGLGDYSIYFLPHSGGRPLELYPTRGEVPAGMALSPDGKRLVFTRFTNTSRLWKLTPGAEPKAVFQEEVRRVSLPRFSPDGKSLAFLVDMAGRNRDLWTMNADGTNITQVSSDPGPKEGGNGWNREGTGLLYNYVDGRRIEFRRYDPVRKTNQVLYSWSSTGGLFHPVLMPDEREVLSACSTPLNICLSPAPGGSPRQITFDREGASYPIVSNDGQWIAYNVRRGDTAQIGITDRAGGHQEILTDDPGLNWPYSFSADNRRVAYASYQHGVWNIWWIDRVTRERKQLTHYTAYGSFVRSPTWRPGTEEIVYEGSQVKGNLYLLNLP